MGPKDCDIRKDERRVTLPGKQFFRGEKKWEGWIFFPIILFKVGL